MYDYLEGVVAQKGPARLVLDVGGVGFDLRIPLGTRFDEPTESDRHLKVWTHLVVRENSHELFGFPTPTLREIFRLLLKVRGVGPSMALGVLSGLSPDELLQAIGERDATPFQRVKGVGKKTAEQILLDLGERAGLLARQLGERGILTPSPPPADGAVEDAVQALISIGYTDKDARKSVDRAAKSVGRENLETLLRTALRK